MPRSSISQTLSRGGVVVACFRVCIDAGSRESNSVRLYSSGLSEIEDVRLVGIHVSRGAPIAESVAAPGVIDCDEIEGPLTRLTLRDGSVSDYASTRFAYTIGDSLGRIGPGSARSPSGSPSYSPMQWRLRAPRRLRPVGSLRRARSVSLSALEADGITGSVEHVDVADPA